MAITQPSPFGVTLRAARIEREMTVKALSGAAGVAERTIRNIEDGTTQRADAIVQKRLVRALGIDVAPRVIDVELKGGARGKVVFVMPDDPADAIVLLTTLMQDVATRIRRDAAGE